MGRAISWWFTMPPGRALTHPCKQGLLQQRDVVACPGVMGQSDKSLHPSAAGLRACAAVRGQCGPPRTPAHPHFGFLKKTSSGTGFKTQAYMCCRSGHRLSAHTHGLGLCISQDVLLPFAL